MRDWWTSLPFVYAIAIIWCVAAAALVIAHYLLINKGGWRYRAKGENDDDAEDHL